MSSNTIDDLDFPKAVLTRIVKSSLPDNIAIQKEARLAVNRASTVFVSYLAATANDCARESGHKIIMPNDVFKALEAVGLGDFIDKLQDDLALHSSIVKQKKDMAAKNKAAGGEGDQEEDEEEQEGHEEQEEQEEEEEAEEDEDAKMGDDNHDDDNKDKEKDADAKSAENMDTGKQGEAAPKLSKEQSEYMDVDDNDSENAKRQRTE
ncbi:hypothetical protein H4R99_007464 [Coemansia sp. RSA 1722]|nr:hypothetical protein IWW45_004081 [Coemansia sp. RSA 485]KAJ2589445.1 hypothetical protein H4R99_007464 [Coemansia sp. RSA 1722]